MLLSPFAQQMFEQLGSEASQITNNNTLTCSIGTAHLQNGKLTEVHSSESGKTFGSICENKTSVEPEVGMHLSNFPHVGNLLSQTSILSTMHATLGRMYQSLFGLFEEHLSQRMEEITKRMDEIQHEQTAMKNRLTKVESYLIMSADPSRLNSDGSQKMSLSAHELTAENSTGCSTHPKATSNRTVRNEGHSVSSMLTYETNTTPHQTPTPQANQWATPSVGIPQPCPISQYSFMSAYKPPRTLMPPHLLWSRWMMSLFGNYDSNSMSSRDDQSTVGSASSICSVMNGNTDKIEMAKEHTSEVINTWSARSSVKARNPSVSRRACRSIRSRGRRIQGVNRTTWSNICQKSHPGLQQKFGLSWKQSKCARVLQFTPNVLKSYSSRNPAVEYQASIGNYEKQQQDGAETKTQKTELQNRETVGLNFSVGYSNEGMQEVTNSVNVPNSVGNPIVVLNPNEPREIFIGGIHTVPLPLWAYKKCLTMVRGEPHELGPRLCLRLLQSLFSLHYLVTHNYNGSGGKAPIDPTVMGAVLRQAQIQFGSGYFFTEPMALGKLRDYLNNAFRVMAFRQRKGERVRSPFWDENGEPVHGLDAPVEFADTSDVIVLTANGEYLQRHRMDEET